MLRQEETDGKADVIRETYYDYAGRPTTGGEGFVTRERTVRQGKTISVRWFDGNGEAAAAAEDTYYRVDYTYDKAGNINREKYYDAEGNPVRCAAGYAIVYREYDAYNRVVYEKYYDTDGFAVMMADGAVSYRYEYDEDGELIRTTKYDYGDHVVE